MSHRRLAASESLGAQKRTLEDQLKKKSGILATRAIYESQVEKVAEQEQALGQIEQQMEQLKQDGQLLSADIKEREGELTVLQEEQGRLQKRRGDLENTRGGLCPTCGTVLDDTHRAHAEQKIKEEEEALFGRLTEGKGWVANQVGRRNALRQPT